MRDRRARRVDSANGGIARLGPGTANLPSGHGRPSVAVVGGGLAGASAAVVLAERGAEVVLYEREPFLGGRLAAWSDRLVTGENVQMERGFHAFFHQYYNLRRFLRRIDPDLGMLQAVSDYPLLGPAGESRSFSGLPRRPPWNMVALVARTQSFDWRALRAIDGPLAGEMLQFDPLRTYERLDDVPAADYLDAVGFPDDVRRMLFEVFSRSFFNRQDDMSAAELVMMFHLYFLGSGEGLLFDVCREPFSDVVWRPLSRELDALGVEVRLGRRVRGLGRVGAGWAVDVEEDDPALTVDAVVLAVTVDALRGLVDRSPDLAPHDEGWRAAVAELEPAPPFAVWRMWLDRPTAVGRPAFVGTAGLGALDNISLPHLYQGESRRWALRHGGSVVELHAYGLPPDAATESESLRRELVAQLHALYPETSSARVVDQRFLLSDDCPGFRPGSHRLRPTVVTPEPTVVLAGDYVRVPFPTALMERAVTTGLLGANHLLGSWGVAPEPVWSVPSRGLLAGLGRLADRRTASSRRSIGAGRVDLGSSGAPQL